MRCRKGGNLSGAATGDHPRPGDGTRGPAARIIKEIAQALNEIRKLRDITIIVSEQVLSFALDVADRLFVIEGGRLVHETPRHATDQAHIKSYLAV
jgi:urea transport system ATP-binding protein